MLINDGLQYAYKMTGRKERITALQLLEGIRHPKPERYGPLTKIVLNSWGIFTTDDIGEVLFNLYEADLMLKTNADRIEDFHAVYDFDQAFINDHAFNNTIIP